MKVQNGVVIILALCSLLFSENVFAGIAKVNWNSNNESDLAGYKVYCGTTPGIYSYIMDVQYCKPIYVSGLQDGLNYNFAVSAYDFSGNESSPSADVQQIVPLNNPLDSLINLSLQSMELLFQIGTYEPGSSWTLKNSLSGTRLDLFAGATDDALPVAIGSMKASDSYVEFDIIPYGYLLNQSATITVPFTGTKASVVRYDESTKTWADLGRATISSGTARFSTQNLGRFRVYSGDNPFSQQVSSNSKGSGGGGGGGGCFMESATGKASMPWTIWVGFILVVITWIFKTART